MDEMLSMSPEALLETLQGMGPGMLIAALVVSIVLSIPPFLVLFSRRCHGGTKFVWFVVTGMFSWLGYVAFLLLTRRPVAPGETAGSS